MLTRFKEFLRDEEGAVTVEYVVVVGGTVTMVTRLMIDISVAVAAFATMTGDFLASDHLSDMLFNTHYNSSYSAPADGGGTDDGTATESGTTSDSGTATDGGTDDGSTATDGNPGNDKDVGKAGETPDGGDDWGTGSNGKSR